ncbi:NAD(+)/NADH kinase [Streptobacillus felis]|uniref:NAD kinase n=1 Tax=Streptobacillus felis TaxID=1384509 RepID=A0A7Z0PG69_9FUSO|nr:NAD(+)/NADH kinase [Streptobacillus felis]NYV27660.1 NAD(+)/NADH kinase [Streptobacillus felis]
MKVKIIKKATLSNNEISYFLEYLNNKNIDIVEDMLDAEILITFGGDGTLLSTVEYLRVHNIPVFSINYGSIGYMTKISNKDAISSFDKFLKGEYRIDHRKFLEVNFRNKTYFALNEISILKFAINSELINVKVEQNKQLINIYKADGIIIASPTGSTAYSLSAGGPIISPELDAICITPLASQSLTARSIILDGNKELSISAYGRSEYVGLNIDGNLHFKLYPEEYVDAKLSNVGIDLIYVDDLNYYNILKQKLHWT